MTEASFDLTEAPWIPCERPDGSRVELGLREALARAHELRGLADPSPLVTASLHRLLLAVLHRCFGPADVAGWLALHAAGRFDAAAVGAYLAAWRHRLDLLHPERPFYQVRGLPPADDPLTCMIAERSSWGRGVWVFEHRPEGMRESLHCAEAARWLVAFHGYAPAGLVKKPGEPTSASAGPLQRGAVLLAQGSSLFETLLFNLLVYNNEQPLPASGDAPSWEADPLPVALPVDKEPRRAPRGWLDLLTWQSRRVELKAEGGRVVGLVRRVGQGLPVGTGEVVADPMMAWRRDEKRGLVPVAFEPSKAFWRDSDVLFHTREERGVVPPRAASQLARAEVADRVGRERRLALSMYGLTADQAAIELTRAEHLPLSPRLLSDDDVGETVVEMIGAAEAVRERVNRAAYALASNALTLGDRTPAKADVSALMSNLAVEARYWTALRAPFEAFLDALAADEKAAGRAFCEQVVRSARRALREGARSLGTDARALKARTLAGERLGALMKDAIPERYRAPQKEDTP